LKIIMYGKKGCGKCDAAESKLKKFGVPYCKKEMQSVTSVEDKNIEALVQWAWDNETLPVFVIDGVGMSYPKAMRRIKNESIKS